MEKHIVAIAANFTAELLEDALCFWLKTLNLPLEIKFAPYDQVFQQLLDPGSLISNNQGGVNIILIRFEDWHKQGSRDKIQKHCLELISGVKSAASHSSSHYFICACPPSESAVNDKKREALFIELERLMRTEWMGISNVNLMSFAEQQILYPVENFYDPYGEKLGHIPYTSSFFVSLGTFIARGIYAMYSKTYKVIVLDCDQTLWTGVCGEDGPMGIVIDTPRRALQQFMLEQHDAGMLICLCSKNNEEDVLDVFNHRSDMILKWNHITSFRLNWKAKSENLKSLAQELQLDLDAFIMLDDNPVECAEIQANCPHILTLQLPENHGAIDPFLRHIWAFDHIKTTSEDKNRTILYQQNIQREKFRSQSSTFQDFIANLNLEIKISAVSLQDLTRISQLTQRTNQFNFTTVRRSPGEIQNLGFDSEHYCQMVDVKDRFGHYGLTGVMIFKIEKDYLDVDTFLLSCRVLGRGVEYKMMAELGMIAQKKNLTEVKITYIATEKNKPALNFLNSIGKPYRRSNDNGFVFVFPADFAAALTYNPAAATINEKPSATGHQVSIKSSPEIDGRSSLLIRIANELNTTEKIQNTIESEKQRVRPDMAVAFAAAQTPIEETLAKIWSQVLGIEKVGIYDNFFSLGGNSLKIVQVITRVYDIFGIELPARLFFDTPFISDIAEKIFKILVAKKEETGINQLLDEIGNFSPAEVEALLEKEALAPDRMISLPDNSISEIYLPNHGVDAPAEYLDKDSEMALANQLSKLKLYGFVINDNAILEDYLPSVKTKNVPPRISSVGFVTKDRPSALKKAINSYISNSNLYERHNNFVIVDDSADPRMRNDCRQMLRSLKKQCKGTVFYAGKEEKKRFADKLIENGLPSEIVNFSLFDSVKFGQTTGANRNALLLHTIGELFFMADDDTLCRAIEPFNAKNGLAFSSLRDPSEYWFFPDHNTALDSVNFVGKDILSAHEKILGRSLGDIITRMGIEHENSFDLLDDEFMKRLKNPHAKIRVTFNGNAGDCAWGSPFGYWGAPIGYLLQNNESHQRLVKSEPDYHANCCSRQILRIVDRFTISDDTFCMTTFTGHDNRELLPPYMPVRGAEDKIFGAVLWKCFLNTLFGNVPMGLVHSPQEERKFWPGEMFRSASGIDTPKLIISCIQSFETEENVEDDTQRLRNLGKHFREIGSLHLMDYAEFIRLQIDKQNKILASRLENHLNKYNSEPDFWANDIKKYIDILYKSASRDDYWIPLDLTIARSREEIRRTSRCLVLQFGQLMSWWSEILEVVRDLKNKEIALAQEV